MNIIDCRKVRDNLISQAKGLILKWKLEPKLAVVQVEGDKASDRYVRNKKIMWDLTTHLLRWPVSKTATLPNAGENVGQPKFSFTAGGSIKRV